MKRIFFFGSLLLLILAFTKGVSSLLSGPEPPQEVPFREKPLGEIFDVENRLLATSVPAKGLAILPQAFSPRPEALTLLAQATGKTREALTVLLSEGRDFIYLPSLSPELEARLEGLEGVFVRRYFERRYPFEAFYPLLGQEGEHLIGLEAYYQRLLSQPETSIRLAIKLEMETALREDVRRTMKILRAKEGGGLILDLSSGRIKAIVTEGDPNLLVASELPLATLASPFEEAYYDSMYEDWTSFLRALGFGEPTGIDLPGERVGVLPLEIEDLQGVYASPIQIVRALATLATGRVFAPKIALAVKSGEEDYIIPITQKKLEDLVPRERGGAWWWGGGRRQGAFLIAGLYPRRHPRYAYLVYVKGVKVYGLPFYYTRFIPKALKQATAKELAFRRKPPSSQKGRMPDVRGLTLKEALEHLTPLGLKVRFSGFGITVKQWPRPGASLKKVRECYLVLK